MVLDAADADYKGLHQVWSLAKPLDIHITNKELYVSPGSRSFYSYAEKVYHLGSNEEISFDGILNLFTPRKFSAYTGLKRFVIRVHYEGSGDFTIVSHAEFMTKAIKTVSLAPTKLLAISDLWLDLSENDLSDLMYFRAGTSAGLSIKDIAILVQGAPRREVNVAIIITTYNRARQLDEQLARLEELSTGDLRYALIVIDNARNFTPKRSYGRTVVIECKNWGGAGGFARGLIEAQRQGGFTHALFMDDDAICHPSAIERAASMAAFSIDGKVAFVAAMNYVEAPVRQYESGALVSSYGTTALRREVDVGTIEEIAANEAAPRPDYGPWWFFFFPMSQVEYFPFPFFVRGDEILFSLQNQFTLERLPCMLAWHPSFEHRISGTVEYLVTRSHMMTPLLVRRSGFSKSDYLSAIKSQIDRELKGLRYGIAEAMCLAIQDVLEGPEFWLDVDNTLLRLKAISEREVQLNSVALKEVPTEKDPHQWEGHLLQFCYQQLGGLLRHLGVRSIASYPVMYPLPQLAFMRRGMVYRTPNGSRRLICVRNKSLYKEVRARADKLLTRLDRDFENCSSLYQSNIQAMQSKTAWERRFSDCDETTSLS